MRPLYLFAVWLHLLSIIVWIGGTVFLVAVVVPVLKKPNYQEVYPSVITLLSKRLRVLSGICIALLIVTGIFMLSNKGFTWASLWNGTLWRGPFFAKVLGVKLLLVVLIFVLSIVHDRQTTRSQASAVRSPARAAGLGSFISLLILIVLALGILLVRGG